MEPNSLRRTFTRAPVIMPASEEIMTSVRVIRRFPGYSCWLRSVPDDMQQDNENFNDALLEVFARNYLNKYDDVRYYTYKNIAYVDERRDH